MLHRIKITERQLAIASIASLIGLLLAWVIPNTIALRHLLLVTGSLTAICLIRFNWDRFRSVNISYLPLFSIFALFIWVLIHYTFFSLNPALELSEIKGLWVRSLLGTVAAIGLGISLVNFPSSRLYFYMACFLIPLINLGSYFWASYLNHGLLKPTDFYRFLFAKIETAYFGAIATAIAVSNLMHLIVGKIEKSTMLQILGWLLGIALVLVSALVSGSKNGIFIVVLLCALLIAMIVINSILHKTRSKVLPGIVVIAILLISISAWQGHKSSAYRGWDTVLQDAALGLDIDTNTQWQKGEGTVPMPLNSLGEPAAINTYTRFAYAAVGVRLINKYPMGYGSINHSFWGLQNLAQIPHEGDRQVHSGWIDLGLAFGIPGLVLVFTSLLSIIYFGFKSKSAVALPWVIVSLALIPFGLIAEITYKQFFEATIFFLSLASTVIILEMQTSFRRSSNDKKCLFHK